MIDGFAPALCLPVRIARRVGHDAGPPVEADGHVFALRGGQSVVTGNAAVGGLELRHRFLVAAPTFPAIHQDAADSSAREPRIIGASPALRELAILPVPQQIEHELRLPAAVWIAGIRTRYSPECAGAG